MPAFTPPTVAQPLGTGPLFGRFNLQVGQSVVRKDGVFTLMPWPWIGDLQAAGTEGTDWFLGGRTYETTEAIAAALEADGFTIDRTAGYGEGGFNTEEFGS